MRQREDREYQRATLEALRTGIRAGHRAQIMYCPTGGGKTEMAIDLMVEARNKGRRSCFLVDRVALVNQTSDRLLGYGVTHGVIQPDHAFHRRGYEPIQVASAQTLERRGFFGDMDLLIVDEAHCVRKQTAELIKSHPKLVTVGLSATPFTRGLGLIYTNIVGATTTSQLLEMGELVPLKIYAAVAPDMAGARIIGGEWADKDVEERGLTIIGDILSEWVDKTRLHFGGPVKTIAFSATVEHGEELCRQFQAAGYNFQQISYKDSNARRRDALIEEFRKPDSSILGLVSCEIFTKGFDCPDVLCGIAARPYRKSLSSHIQQLGRVMRKAPGKKFGVWLDHCGNALRFAADTENVFAAGCMDLSENEKRDSAVRKEPTEAERAERKCVGCGFVLPRGAQACPACGKERPKLSLVQTAPGVMVTVGGREIEATGKHAYLADRDAVWRQLCAIALDRKRGDAHLAQKFAQAQYNSIYGAFAHRQVTKTEAMRPCAELRGLVQHNLIRFANRRERAAA